MMNNSQADQKLKQMDFQKDQRAWEMAKRLAEKGEALSTTVARAQQIKESL